MKTGFVYHNHIGTFKDDVNDFGRVYVKSFVPYGFEDDSGDADRMMDTRHTNGFVRFRIFYELLELLRVEAETISLSLEPSDDVELVDYCNSIVAWLRSRYN